MDIHKLKCFLAVAKEQSFSGAARKLHCTQPAITLQIKALEERLGLRLFYRKTSKQVSLTKEGQSFIAHVEPIVFELDSLLSKFQKDAKDISNKLCIATHSSVVSCLLPLPIQALKKRHPKISITFITASKAQIVELVKSGAADLGISAPVETDSTLHYERISKYPRMIVAPSNHPLIKAKSISPRLIAQYPLILPPKGSSTRLAVDATFLRENLSYELALEVTSRESALSYIALDLGVGIVSSYYFPEKAPKGLKARNVQGLFGFAERGVFWRKGEGEAKSKAEDLGREILGEMGR